MDKHQPPSFDSRFYGPRYWPTWLTLAVFKLIAVLPLSITVPIGRTLGWLSYHLAKRRRRIAEINIEHCFPELSAAEQQCMVKANMTSIGISLIETATALWGPDSQFNQRYTIDGLEHLDQAMASDQGVLLVGEHFTTLDAAARILSFHHKFDMLYRKDPNPLLAYKLISARESFAGTAIVRSDTRQLIKNLRKGHLVWYAPDQDFGRKHSVFAPFFGIQAATVMGTAKIAKLGRATVLPFAHYRDPNGNYRLEIKPAIEGFPSGDDVADATTINGHIESAIRKQPDQYLWVHRRFKTRPEGEVGFYPKREK